MNRRKFFYTLGLGLATGWAARRLFLPLSAKADNPKISVALLADAHLRHGDPDRPEARALALAVAEIRSLEPPPHLVLFAGDLAHDGNPDALALGEEILSELPMPILAVRGEGDGSPKKGEPGWKLFGQGRFIYNIAGVTFLGLDTGWQDTNEGPGFVLGENQNRWLDHLLSQLDPARPLFILSHAPLTPIFRPWGQWTVDSGPLIDRLSRFPEVLCLHGHVHLPRTSSPFKKLHLSQSTPSPTSLHHGGRSGLSFRHSVRHLSLSATSWPLPYALEGTPPILRPGFGPQGCGWALLNHRGQSFRFYPLGWQA